MTERLFEVEEKYMLRAIELARLGMGEVSPNPMVGCVIVHNGVIIGEGYHSRFGMAHAEVNAINRVKEKELLRESTLYVTLEPCSHHGKTPPCADLILLHRIPNVVVGTVDPFAEVSGRGIQKLRMGGCRVIQGYLEEKPILVTPIHNEVLPGYHVILDGQHRYEACRYLNVPFTFTIVHNAISKNDIINKIKSYNINQVNLKSVDYVKINSDKASYVTLDKLTKITGFNTNIILNLTKDGKKNKNLDFKNGEFVIRQEDFDHIIEVCKFNNIIKDKTKSEFQVNGIYIKPLSDILKDENIDHSILESKLINFGTAQLTKNIQSKNTVTLYTIYNHASRERDRVTTPERFTKKIKKW